MKRKKASRANKAAPAATPNSAPSPTPPQQGEPERPTMRARLLAFFSWFQVQPATVDKTNITSGGLAWGKKRRKREKKQRKLEKKQRMREETKVPQSAMYAANLDGPGARVWKAKPARRGIPFGPTIGKLLATDAKIVEPYEQERDHVDYLAIRSTNESGWDTCSACYFRQPSRTIPIKTNNLDRHFNRKHNWGGARERCSVCTAMLFTRHLKWHTKYCHPGIAVKEILG